MTRWPTPPDYLRGGVGAGVFWKVGFEIVSLIGRHAGINADDRVLDVGSGLGRVAYLIAQVLEAGTYTGIDNVRDYVEWCNAQLGLDRTRFQFEYADVYSTMYNPAGTITPETFRFPYNDDTFTLVVATSLFTHLSAVATANYLREIYRTLAPGGRLFATFFVLDEDSRSAIASGTTCPEFSVEIPYGLIANANSPDEAVAFDSKWLHQAFLGTGYVLDAFLQGTWRRASGTTHQDLVVARKS